MESALLASCTMTCPAGPGAFWRSFGSVFTARAGLTCETDGGQCANTRAQSIYGGMGIVGVHLLVTRVFRVVAWYDYIASSRRFFVLSVMACAH